MASTSKKTRIKQKEKAEKAYKARIDALTESGVTGKDQEKDSLLRRAKAELKKANQRLNAIDAKIAHVEKVKQEKAQKEKQKDPSN